MIPVLSSSINIPPLYFVRSARPALIIQRRFYSGAYDDSFFYDFDPRRLPLDDLSTGSPRLLLIDVSFLQFSLSHRIDRVKDTFYSAFHVYKSELQTQIDQFSTRGKVILCIKAFGVLIKLHFMMVLILRVEIAGNAILIERIKIVHVQCTLNALPDHLCIVPLHFIHAGWQILVSFFVKDMENVLYRLNG